MKYVLVFLMFSTRGMVGYGGPATAEFESREACQQAQLSIASEVDSRIKSVCLNKQTGTKD